MTQKFVYQKRPNKIFPTVNFVFSHDGHFGLDTAAGPNKQRNLVTKRSALFERLAAGGSGPRSEGGQNGWTVADNG